LNTCYGRWQRMGGGLFTLKVCGKLLQGLAMTHSLRYKLRFHAGIAGHFSK